MLRRFLFNRPTYKRFGNQKSWSERATDPKFQRYAGLFVLGCGVFYVANLKPAPISGRKRFMVLPEFVERWMGQLTYNQLMAQYKHQVLPLNHPQTVRVRKIMHRIIQLSETNQDESSRSHDQKVNWEIHVINSNDSPNAFVVPGGKVFVFTSLLPILKNDDGLATVLSHEFLHQLLRHSGEQLSKSPIYFMITLLLLSVLQDARIANLAVQLLLQMPLSREMETEADYIGLMLMSKACFDPRELSKLWQRFDGYERSHGGGVPEYLSTHPSSQRRLHNMESWLKELNLQREMGHCDDLGGWFNDFNRFNLQPGIFGIDTRGRSGENGGLW